MQRIAELKNIIAIKEASGSISQIMEVCKKLRSRLTVLSGDDSMTLPLISVGGRGIISVLSNLMPKEMVTMVSEALKGDFQKALEMHEQLLDIMGAMFVETSPVPVKYAMFKKGLIPSCEVRPPLVELSEASRATVERCL
jgi:4-hydroxy-tetrahydrodipicolinate synthase